jgi:hypothetical protein
MKSTITFLLVTLLFKLSIGQTTVISDRIEVKFPSAPEQQQLGNKTFYMVSESSYVVTVMFADMSHEANFDIKPDSLSRFYKGVINGTLAAATDSKLLEERTIQVGQFEGKEIKYTKDFNGADDILVTKWILLVDKAVYTFDFWNLSGKEKKELEEEFFESIVVK